MAVDDAIGVGLMGLGAVGSGVASVLAERTDLYARRVGRPLQLRAVLVRDLERSRAVRVAPGLLTTDARRILDDVTVQIVIEVMGGEEPAFSYIAQALGSGRHVVTANKEVMAKHGPELLSLARRRNVELLYEASVGGGIPIIAPLKRDLLANELTELQAIINGTTNYILTRMAEEECDFQVALAAAQLLGYAEAEPTNDVEGFDATYKLAILAGLVFRSEIRPQDIYREGITKLTARDFRYARELGYAVKLLARGRRAPGGLELRVHPALIPLSAPLARVGGVYNAVQLEGDLLGTVLLQGQGAGSMPTTSAVVADLIDVAHRIAQGAADPFPWVQEAPIAVAAMSTIRTRYYLRLYTADQPGVLHDVTGVFTRFDISIASMIQKETDEAAQTAELVFITHDAVEAAMQAALVQIAQLKVVAGIGALIRIEA